MAKKKNLSIPSIRSKPDLPVTYPEGTPKIPLRIVIEHLLKRKHIVRGFCRFV